MTTKDIVFIGIAINNDPNRTQYQRCLLLSKNFNAYIFLANNKIPFPPKISPLAKGVYRFPLSPIFRFLFPIWVVVKTLFILRQKPKNTIIYSTYHSLSILTGAIFKLFGFQTVVDIWDDPLLPVLHESKRNIKKRHKLLVNKLMSILALRLLKSFDMLILALSQSFKQILYKYGVREERIFHITNGVDIGLIKSYSLSNIYKSNDFTICYVGHVSWITGCDILVEAVIKLHKKYPDIRLELIGDYNPKEESWLEKRFRKNPELRRIINLRGYLSHKEVLNLITKSTVCVYPFPDERQYRFIYPIKVLEYMAMGKVIIASKLEGVRELLSEGHNALFFEPGSVSSLVEKLRKVYHDRKLCIKLMQNAANDVINYDWSRINRQILGYLQNL